ncbi:rhoptry neck protein 12, putative [Plasmodium ovale wallikeri]|uniref:Rhoptry neck protein 12, putative n=1 Tax=Plasmodium ovale wallikeri TaxID=864142 RepID=A0A1A9AHS6_PLAOA|nr:rhoptry neck protein 12, putative [Plasmodium ovale wallikeri]SBT56142.1 rhoptry neck protein 12, putative [Plasmodium ovale wallikeri]
MHKVKDGHIKNDTEVALENAKTGENAMGGGCTAAACEVGATVKGGDAKGEAATGGAANGGAAKGEAATGGAANGGAAKGEEANGEKEVSAHVKDGKLQNVGSEKNGKNVESKEDESLKNIIVSEEAFESGKAVCEHVVIQSSQFKKFCTMTDLFKDIENLKNSNNKLYEDIINGSYESKDASSFKMLKDDGNKKIVMESDKHNPKFSMLFLYQKLCVGGIPLACANILKVDNIFDMNQSNANYNSSQEKIDVDDMEKDLTTEGGEQTGVEENISDLTDG